MSHDNRTWPVRFQRLKGRFTRDAQKMSSDQDQADVRMKLARLKQEHDDYHAAIDAMIAQRCDPLQIQRMKKKKLDLKDQIKKLSSTLIPDIIA